jgi:hypothetical protein
LKSPYLCNCTNLTSQKPIAPTPPPPSTRPLATSAPRVHFLAPRLCCQHRQFTVQSFGHIHRKPDRCFESRVLGVGESDCSSWMERGLILLLMRTTAVVLRLAIKRTVVVLSGVLMLAIKRMVLAMLWVLVLEIKRMVVLGLVKFFCNEDKFFDRAGKWFAFLGVHVNAPMRSAVRAKSYLSSPTPKNLSRIRFLRMFYCTRTKIP